MRVLLIGAPGAGKGTQAEFIAQRFGLTHLSSGDLLRENVAQGTELGVLAQEYMARGDLVPNELVLEMLREPVIAAAEQGGYILDGFPRNVDQARAGYDITRPLGVNVQLAVVLEVAREALIDRIVERGKTSGRLDDTREVVEHRLEVYEASTTPLLAYYAEREQLITIDGDRPVEVVTADLIAELERVQAELDAS